MKAARQPVSFIISAYNCAATIRQTVESIFDGNFEDGDEVILVDDCSTDRTPTVLEEIRQRGTSVRILTHSHTRGTGAAARNTGIEVAENETLFCLDADNVLAPRTIAPLCEYMRATKADAAAFRELHYFRRAPTEVTHKWIYKERITLADALAGDVWPGPSGNYLFTRASWRRAGRYHEPFLENRSLDTWVFGIRQLGTGSKMVTLAGTWYFHRYGHRSHFVRTWQRGNRSLAALIGLIPFLDQIREDDVEYIMSKQWRGRWYEMLSERPLRLRSGPPGRDGRIEYLPAYWEEQSRPRSRIRKVLSRLRGAGR